MIKFIPYVLFICLLYACGNEQPTINAQAIEQGKVISSIQCVSDPSLSYAIYLPKGYNESKEWPIIYCFDSHAGGATPLHLYHAIAEKYGLILVGSNNSKNGLQAAMYEYIAANMMNDVKSRFKINTQQQFALGFSGGARVAASVAEASGEISSIICCGAGISQLNNRLHCFMYAGNLDFNYLEVIQADSSLTEQGVTHQTILFNGEHAWPTEALMNLSFLWLSVQMNHNAESANAIKDVVKQGIDTCKNDSDVLTKHMILQYGLFAYQVPNADNPFIADFNNIKQSVAYKQAIQQREKLAKKEMQWQQTMREAFSTKDLKWWNDVVINMLHTTDNEQLYMHTRVLNYCSIMAYMATSNAIRQKSIESAEHFTTIYTLVDSDNNEAWYLRATAHMMKKEYELSLRALQQAIKYKFNDKARLLNDSVFIALHDRPDFKTIASQLK